MKNKISLLFAITCVFNILAFSQSLSVKQIMAEPSLAGMRAEGEKLSPDGGKVVFLWNSEGKEPKNLYLWDGGEPKIIVRPKDLLPANPTPTPETKLNYGLIVKDDFAKALENQIGNIEWSPDSSKILFSQNGDIYVLDFNGNLSYSTEELNSIKRKWANCEAQMVRRLDLLPNFVEVVRMTGVNERILFEKITNARQKVYDAINESPKGENGDKSNEQKKNILFVNSVFDNTSKTAPRISLRKVTKKPYVVPIDERDNSLIGQLLILSEKYPKLRSDESFFRLQDELAGVENRINVAKLDYSDQVTYSQAETSLRRLTKTQSPEFSARWLDNKRILFQQNGNLFSINTEDVSLIQLSKEANPTAFISVGNALPTKDAKMVAYIVSDGSKQRALFVPNYLDEFVQAPTFRRGWSDQKILVVQSDGSRETPFEIKLPKSEGVGYIRSIRWAADNASLVVDRIDKDTKRRQIYYVNSVGSKGEQIILVTEEIDEKWIAPLSRFVEPNPKNNSQILFASEKDGYNHLYLATLERQKAEPNPKAEIRQENPTDSGFTSKVDIKQLTSGKFEIDWAKWSNEKQLIFSSTETTTSERDFYQIDLDSKKKDKIAGGEIGMRTNPQLSDSSNATPFLLFTFSTWNKPSELQIQKVCVGCRGLNLPYQITKTAPESFLKTKWNEPKFIDIPSRDGRFIKSKIYMPSNAGNSKLPMVIFVHGAGYLQNTINGWNNYYREFMFNQLLTQQGYVVLDIDYRGSAGYGRDWRTDVYDFLGGKDYEDHLDAIDYAVKNFNVNEKKIGVYGGSYGGFMAEMLAFRTDKIACAAALRPVADWKNYYASSNVYTAERLGFPDKNPEGYKRSSPISYAEGLNKPLLILHGMVDDNVHAQDSVQLIEKLMRLEKTEYFESMFYPSENHGFTRPTSWTDEYGRILRFFEKHLK